MSYKWAYFHYNSSRTTFNKYLCFRSIVWLSRHMKTLTTALILRPFFSLWYLDFGAQFMHSSNYDRGASPVARKRILHVHSWNSFLYMIACFAISQGSFDNKLPRRSSVLLYVFTDFLHMRGLGYWFISRQSDFLYYTSHYSSQL